MSRTLVPELSVCNAAKVLVDQRVEAITGLRIAVPKLEEKLGDLLAITGQGVFGMSHETTVAGPWRVRSVPEARIRAR
jgi:hypothetical protein